MASCRGPVSRAMQNKKAGRGLPIPAYDDVMIGLALSRRDAFEERIDFTAQRVGFFR